MSVATDRCPHCEGTLWAHDLLCPVLVEAAERDDGDWGRGTRAIQRFLRGETDRLKVEEKT